MLSVDIQHRLGEFSLDCQFQSQARITGIFGPSGAGKSSLLRALAGLIRPDAGHIEIDGQGVFDHSRGQHIAPHQRQIGYVFQQARLFTHLNVNHNLRYGAWFARTRLQPHDFDKVVDMLDIGPLLSRHVAGLSGGEQQRVAIGRALLSNPRLLLFDEPLASLDDTRKHEVLPYLERLRDELRLPMVYVTHQHEELLRLANRHVAVLDAGRVIFSGETAEFMTRPALLGPEQARDAGVLLTARVSTARASHGLTELDIGGQRLFVPEVVTKQETVQVHVRARDVMLARQRPEQISALNTLDAQITELADAGPYSVDVHMDCDGQRLTARVTQKSAKTLQLAAGDPVIAIIKSLALAEQAWQRIAEL